MYLRSGRRLVYLASTVGAAVGYGLLVGNLLDHVIKGGAERMECHVALLTTWFDYRQRSIYPLPSTSPFGYSSYRVFLLDW